MLTGIVFAVVVTADSPEAAWRLAAHRLLTPYRLHQWDDSDSTLRLLLYRLRHGNPLTGTHVVSHLVMPQPSDGSGQAELGALCT